MRRVTAKRIREQARANARGGSVIINKEYDRLKKEYKSHSQDPKFKNSKRQQRKNPPLGQSGEFLMYVSPNFKKAFDDEIKRLMKDARQRNPKRRVKAKPWR